MLPPLLLLPEPRLFLLLTGDPSPLPPPLALLLPPLRVLPLRAAPLVAGARPLPLFLLLTLTGEPGPPDLLPPLRTLGVLTLVAGPRLLPLLP